MSDNSPDTQVEFADLTIEHYAGFGMVVTMACHLDVLLDKIIDSR